MRHFLAASMISLLLAGCQTLSETPISVPPLQIGAGEGAVSMKLCMSGQVAEETLEIYTRRLSDENGRLKASDDGDAINLTKMTLFSHKFLEAGRRCYMWQFANKPGIYTISEFREYFSGASRGPRAGSLSGILNALAREKMTVSYLNADGSPKETAPTFDIREAHVSKLGTLTLHGELKSYQVPVKNKDGTWDGQSTDIVHAPRITASYDAPHAETSDHGAPIVGNSAGTSLQPLTPLMGHEILFVEVPSGLVMN